MKSPCVSTEQLQAFLGGRMECDEESAISQHIDQCGECDRKIAALTDDGLARRFSCLSSQAELTREANGAVEALSRRMQALALYDLAAKTDSSALGRQRDEECAVPASARPLTRLGRYRIVRPLGAGTFGVVYLAEDQRLNRKVALKIARTNVLGDEELQLRFFREAATLARLAHPNIVPVYEADEINGLCFLVFAFCDGPTLEAWLCERGAPLEPRLAAALLAPLADAVEHAHLQGVLHRDIKPGNILLHRASPAAPHPVVPQLTDFGLAKLMEDDSQASVSGLVLGTPQYMAPEQAAGHSEDTGPATDVYALGAVLYRMLTGQAPIGGHSTVDTLRRVLIEHPLEVQVRVSRVPADLNAIVMKCLEKSPADRYARAGDLADDLRRFLHGRPTKARPLGNGQKVIRWVRRNPALSALLTLAVAVVGLSLGLWNYAERLSQTQSVAAREAQKSRALAEQMESSTLSIAHRDYVNDIRVAAVETLRGNTSKAVTALTRQIPEPDKPDLRGFGWHCLWSMVHRKPLAETDAGEDVYQIRLSPDERELVAAGKDGVLRFYDAVKLTLREAVPAGQGELNGIAYSPSGQKLATAGDNGTVCIWDVATRRLDRTIAAHPGYAYDVVFFDGGDKIASCGREPTIRLWDIAGEEAIGTLTGHAETVESLALSPDGQLLASASSDRSAIVWNLHEQRAVQTLTGFGHRLTSIGFAPNGRWLATGSLDRSATLWDVQSGRRLAQQVHLEGVQGIAFSRDSKRLKVADCSGTIRNYSIVQGKTANPTLKLVLRSLDDAWGAHPTRLWSIAAGAHNRILYSAAKDGVVRSWRPDREHPVQRTILPPRRDPFVDLDFSADGRSLFAVREASGVVVFDAVTLQERRILHSRHTEWRALCSLPDRGEVAAGNAQGLVAIWDLKTGEQRMVFESSAESEPVADLAYSQPAGVLAILQPSGACVLLYDAAAGEFVGRLPLSNLSAMAMSPDGKRLAVGSDNNVVVYDLTSREPLHVLHGHRAAIRALAFSPDGGLVASGSADRTVRFWSKEGQQLAALTEYSSTVSHLQFTPDGMTLISGDEAGVLKLMHVVTKRAMFDLPTNSDHIRGLAIAPGSRQLAAILAANDILVTGPPRND